MTVQVRQVRRETDEAFRFAPRSHVRNHLRHSAVRRKYALARAQPRYYILSTSLANPEHHLVEVQNHPARRERHNGRYSFPSGVLLYQSSPLTSPSTRELGPREKDRAGQPLTVQQLNKSRWQVSGAEVAQFTGVLQMRFVDSFGPFGAQLNSHHAFFNLAQLLIYPVDARR